MKVFAKFAVAAAAVAIVIPASASDSTAVFYGRAGGTVADQRIHQIANIATQDLAASELDTGLGRAGGPATFAVAKTPTTNSARQQTVTAVQWYGRAGGPLPFGG